MEQATEQATEKAKKQAQVGTAPAFWEGRLFTMHRIRQRFFVGFSAIMSFAVLTAAAQAQQVPGQFQGPFQGNPQFQGFRGGAAAFGAFGNPGHPAVNNMGGFGGFPVGFGNRFMFRQGDAGINTAPVAVNATLNGRNTTIYSNVNPSNYLGSVGSGQAAQFGQFGQFGGGQFGAVGQPGIVFGQQVGSASGQFGQFGQFGQTTNVNQFGSFGGVGGKPPVGFGQIGGGGQFGSRYGL